MRRITRRVTQHVIPAEAGIHPGNQRTARRITRAVTQHVIPAEGWDPSGHSAR